MRERHFVLESKHRTQTEVITLLVVPTRLASVSQENIYHGSLFTNEVNGNQTFHTRLLSELQIGFVNLPIIAKGCKSQYCCSLLG